MANRLLKQFQYTYENDTVTMFGSAVIGAAGAVGTVKGGGIKSVTKETGDGKYTIELTDRFARLLSFQAGTILATISGVARVQLLMNPATLQSSVKADGKLTVQCVDADGVAVNPASGEVLSFRIVCRNTNVGPFDT